MKPKFEYLGSFSEGLAKAKANGKWGVINKQGGWVLQPSLESMYVYSGGIAQAGDGINWVISIRMASGS
jgi:hypothetical protein